MCAVIKLSAVTFSEGVSSFLIVLKRLPEENARQLKEEAGDPCLAKLVQ